MALAPLATVADLEALGVPTDDDDLVASLLESVSAEVREAAGVPISLTTATLALAGSREQYLPLPVQPVVSVARVELDGVQVADWRLVDGRLWRAAGWAGRAPSRVDVTLEYGFAKVPADIVRLVCMLVSAGMHAAADGFGATRGLTYESIDDARIGYATGDAEIVDPTAIPQRTKDALKARFSGSAYVTGGY